MRTAVQIRPRTRDGDGPRTEILCGLPCGQATSALGPVALFGSGEIVAYLLRRRRRLRLFVFRTLDVDDRLAPTVLASFHASDCSWSCTLPCAFGEPEASSRISRVLAATPRP